MNRAQEEATTDPELDRSEGQSRGHTSPGFLGQNRTTQSKVEGIGRPQLVKDCNQSVDPTSRAGSPDGAYRQPGWRNAYRGLTPTGDRATSYKIDYSLKSADHAKLWALNIKTVPYTPYRTMALKYANNKSNKPNHQDRKHYWICKYAYVIMQK